jgi:hypothetical protein
MDDLPTWLRALLPLLAFLVIMGICAIPRMFMRNPYRRRRY